MHCLRSLRTVLFHQLDTDLANDFGSLVSVVGIGELVRLDVPELGQLGRVYAKVFGSFKQEAIVVLVALHVKTVEAQLDGLCRRLVVRAHPRE